MKRISKIYYSRLILLAFLLFFCNSNSQTFTDSNLPIVVINTDIDPITLLPIEIPDNPRILASMKIIRHNDGSRNYLTDQNTSSFLNYNGRINIEIRGSSSQTLPKKPYGLTTLLADNISNNNVSLLGMPSENDWILNALAFDPSLIRDYISYNLSRQIGQYAPRTVYCEVVVNGEYKGLYMLQEKVKADSNRVNILKITTSDITYPNITGGYITKADKTTGGDPVAWTTYNYISQPTNYIHDLPKPVDVTTGQNAYIYNVFNDFQSSITSNNSSLSNGYPSKIDIPTFIDFMLLNEFAANADGYEYSTYFHKDRNGKLRAGPIFDFNLTFGNDLFQWGFDRSKTNTWQFSNGDNEGSKFWNDLYNNSIYKCYLSKRFNNLIQTGKPFNQLVLNSFIDSTISLISEAMVRENLKWGTIPNNPLEIVNLKSFIANRINWMTNNLGSFTACNTTIVPSLVISKIHYNPSFSTSFPVSNDQEFIEITNTGSTTVNLSGIYFNQLGLTYQFPYNSTLTANSVLYLASNATVFQTQNGFAPFGVFTRNLSNKSQKIEISDAFGNLIDSVEYFDSAPWPTAPDGNGSYLQLTDNSLDNNLASSWVSSSTALSNSNFDLLNSEIQIYPNPSNSIIEIKSKNNIQKLEIYTILGELVKEINSNDSNIQIDISNLTNGIYIMKIESENSIITKKLIKE